MDGSAFKNGFFVLPPTTLDHLSNKETKEKYIQMGVVPSMVSRKWVKA